MKIRTARSRDEAAVKRLLKGCRLPWEDISALHFHHFFCSTEGTRFLGVVGLEVRVRDALLRSLAVAPGIRGRGLGRRLVARAEKHAQTLGIKSIYLLTTTAEDFFARLGYKLVDRNAAPRLIQETREFASICPSSAVCMVKRLKPPGKPPWVPDEVTTDAVRMDIDSSPWRTPRNT